MTQVKKVTNDCLSCDSVFETLEKRARIVPHVNLARWVGKDAIKQLNIDYAKMRRKGHGSYLDDFEMYARIALFVLSGDIQSVRVAALQLPKLRLRRAKVKFVLEYLRGKNDLSDVVVPDECGSGTSGMITTKQMEDLRKSIQIRERFAMRLPSQTLKKLLLHTDW